MRNIIRIVFVICCLGSLAVSCKTTALVSVQPELEQQWIGHSYADVVDTLGQPEREVADIQDGKILVYESGTLRFYMNSDSLCYAVRTSRQREETKFSMSRSFALGGAIAGGILVVNSIIQTLLQMVGMGRYSK